TLQVTNGVLNRQYTSTKRDSAGLWRPQDSTGLGNPQRPACVRYEEVFNAKHARQSSVRPATVPAISRLYRRHRTDLGPGNRRHHGNFYLDPRRYAPLAP